MIAKDLMDVLQRDVDPTKAMFFPRFFKTGPGEYGEGDKFIGVKMGPIKAAVKKYKDLPLTEVSVLCLHEIHEYRMAGFQIMVLKMQKAKLKEDKIALANFYLEHKKGLNNWDIIDTTAYKILGPYAEIVGNGFLIELGQSNQMWDNRIAMVTTFYFIRKNQLDLTFELAEMLYMHTHDLMHKAVGWMLREAGKRNPVRLVEFLETYYDQLPRTLLRYAIEKFPEPQRKPMLSGDFQPAYNALL